jgi:hypothetical protein
VVGPGDAVVVLSEALAVRGEGGAGHVGGEAYQDVI